MQYINTSDSERYGVFTESPVRGWAYRYVANPIVDVVEADPEPEEAYVPPDRIVTGGPSVNNLATHRWRGKGLRDAATEAGLIQRIKDGARTRTSKPNPRDDDQRAFRELLEAFHGFVIKHACRYVPTGTFSSRMPNGYKHTSDLLLEDLTSVGFVALWQSALKFDLNDGHRFATLSRHKVIGAMSNEANYQRRKGRGGGKRIERWLFSHLGDTPEELLAVQKKLGLKRPVFHSLEEAAAAIKAANAVQHCEVYSDDSDACDIERGWIFTGEDDVYSRPSKPTHEWREVYDLQNAELWSPQLRAHCKVGGIIDFWINEFCCPPRIKSKPQPNLVCKPCLVKPTSRVLHPIGKPYWMEPREKRPKVRAGLPHNRDRREVAPVRFKDGKMRRIYRQMAANPGRHIQLNEVKGKQNHVRANREQAIGGPTAEIVVFQSRGSSVEGLHLG
jgi:hypothetical protein